MSHHVPDILKETDQSEQLVQLMEKLEVVNFFLATLEDFMKRTPFILESLSEEVIRFRERFRESEDGVRRSIELLSKLYELMEREDVARLLTSVFEAYTEVKENNYRTSITGVVRAMTDEDIQRALAFLLLTLKKMGQALGGRR
ncbi:protein of unknown function DUF1641 [Thermocrinis albus DSM 14484]|uniref:DUF1641 domain-containing protein n=1 Tax=Thermocrinis albus (strain DSM 14484 / JCM 11386 / HI 11/12) TaxID=638303 RepID=D3SMQ9_THEAH|nr:DUF1641 domain-containing protein [Thermocrinis albus]ADC90039.1 protein of unknown function DUF1641 [Thermocrinis albus DSM 14484]